MPFIFDPDNYDTLLKQKVDDLHAKFTHLYQEKSIENLIDISTFDSPKQHYRMRAEFRIWHEGDECFPVMFDKTTKQPQRINDFPIASEVINQLIKALPNAINASPILSKRLFQIECLSAQSQDCVLTMTYHKALEDDWQHAALALQNSLSEQLNNNIYIVGRSRKQKVVLSQDFVTETFNVGSTPISYKQIEGSFTQPNAAMNYAMLNWTHQHSSHITGDALELYCGNGNFTLALAQHFNKVFATEVVKSAVQCAQQNISDNQLNNVYVARLSSEEFTQAMNGVREFRRLKDIDLGEYNFSTVLVDPPRSGLDDDTCMMIQSYEYIIYISCNPTTLIDNLKTLCDSHNIQSIACFDQFPYTDHLECGVILQRK